MRLIGGSSVHTNNAGKAGGGLVVTGTCTVNIFEGSSVHSNRALDGAAGGLTVGTGAHVTISGSTVSNNSCACGVGGGIAVDPELPNAGKATFDARGRVATVEGWDSMSFVPGAPTNDPVAPVDLANDNTCGDNRIATYGVTFSPDPTLYRKGVPSFVIISNSSVANNTSIRSAGGGIAAWRNGTIELVNGTLLSQDVSVEGSGGGVMLLDYATLHADKSV